MNLQSANNWVRIDDRPAVEGVAHFQIPEESRCFAGHFDTAPILPGVAHLALAMAALSPDGGVRLAGVRDVRFTQPILPGSEIQVRLTAGADSTTRRFELRCRGQLVSSGVLLLTADDPF